MKLKFRIGWMEITILIITNGRKMCLQEGKISTQVEGLSVPGSS